MPKMVRKQIYLEPEQEEMLKSLSEESGLSEAELVREALKGQVMMLAKRYPVARERYAVWKSEEEFIKDLIEQGPIKAKRGWTREALYDDRVKRSDRND